MISRHLPNQVFTDKVLLILDCRANKIRVSNNKIHLDSLLIN